MPLKKQRHSNYLITVETHDEAALFARPMEIEERRLAYVAHFTYTLHDTFPRYRFICKSKQKPMSGWNDNKKNIARVIHYEGNRASFLLLLLPSDMCSSNASFSCTSKSQK